MKFIAGFLGFCSVARSRWTTQSPLVNCNWSIFSYTLPCSPKSSWPSGLDVHWDHPTQVRILSSTKFLFIYLFLYYIFCVYWQSVKHLQDPFHAFPQYLDGNNRVFVRPHWHGAIDKLIDEACWAHTVKLKATTALSTLALRTVWPLPALDNRNTES